MSREEQAVEFCRRLAADIARAAPAGSGEDEQRWASVAGSADEFLAELHRWEVDGDRARVPLIRDLYDRAVAAWKAAA